MPLRARLPWQRDWILWRGDAPDAIWVGMSTMIRKTARTNARKTASKPSSGAKTRFKAPPAAKKAASHILSAPKGARTLTHREIKQAVERVFEERHGADA